MWKLTRNLGLILLLLGLIIQTYIFIGKKSGEYDKYFENRMAIYGNQTNGVDTDVSINKKISDFLFNTLYSIETKNVINITANDIKGSRIAGIEFEIIDKQTEIVVDTIKTNSNGNALSRELLSNRIYRIVQMENDLIFSDKMVNEVFLNDSELNIEVLQHIAPHILRYKFNEKGLLEVEEVRINVPLELQKPELPNGCEITALTSLLLYYDIAAIKTELSDNYLRKENFYYENGKLYGSDPNLAFAGDPRNNDGWYVFEEPIIDAGNNYLKDISFSSNLVSTTGESLNSLIELVTNGKPVIVWTTIDHTDAKYGNGWFIKDNESFYKPFTNLHAVVIMGYNKNKIFLMDPLKGYTIVDKNQFESSVESLGNRSIIFDHQ